jgi:hypothetical protein
MICLSDHTYTLTMSSATDANVLLLGQTQSLLVRPPTGHRLFHIFKDTPHITGRDERVSATGKTEISVPWFNFVLLQASKTMHCYASAKSDGQVLAVGGVALYHESWNGVLILPMVCLRVRLFVSLGLTISNTLTTPTLKLRL